MPKDLLNQPRDLLESVPAPENKFLGASRSFLEGLTANFSDEIGSAATTAAVMGGNPPYSPHEGRGLNLQGNLINQGALDESRKVYRGMQDAYSQRQGQFERENPYLSTGAEVAGGFGAGLVGAAKTAGMQGIPRYLALGAEGAAYGGLSGAGDAEPGKILESAIKTGVFGAGLSVAIPFVGSYAGKAVQRLISGQPVSKADRAILNAIAKDEQTPLEVRNALIRMQDATLSDVGGKNMQSLVRESRAVPGPGAQQAEEFFIDRMKGEYTRLMVAFKKGLGKSGEFFKTKKSLIESRQAAAKPLYDDAYQTPIQTTPELQALLERPSVKRAYIKAIEKAKDEGINLEPGAIDTRSIDYTKRALDDMIGKAQRAGENDRARVLTQTKNEILAIVDAQNPAFKDARAVWSGSKELENALDEGAKFMRGDSDVIAQDVANMTDAQKEFFRLGALRAVKNYIGNTRDTNSIAQKFQNPAMRERLEAVFPDDAAYKEITDFIEKEAQFGVTRNEILKGSQTYEKFLSNQAGVDAGDIAIDLATGNKMGLLWALKNATSAKFNQPNPKTAAEIIGRTTNPDLAENLQYLQRLQSGGASINPKYRNLLDALGPATIAGQ